MLDNYDDIIRYLIERNLITGEKIIQSDLKLLEVPGRNTNFLVTSKEGPSYFLKCTHSNYISDSEFATIGYERLIYKFLKSAGTESPLHNYLPHCISFHRGQNILTLELIQESVSLFDFHFQNKYFPSKAARELGKSLAILHETFLREKSDSKPFTNINDDLPYIFSLPQSELAAYLKSSNASIELIKIFQKFEVFSKEFDELKLQWRKETLIHGDMKWRNCLVPGKNSSHKLTVKIIDWELSCLGDSSWDTGTVFSEYLNFWVSSIPCSDVSHSENSPDSARFPLHRMHSSIRSFWNAYSSNRSDGFRNGEELLRAVKYAGVRLLQTQFEKLQFESEITNEAIYAAQICLNILERPAEAVVQLLGMTLPFEPGYEK